MAGWRAFEGFGHVGYGAGVAVCGSGFDADAGGVYRRI